MVVVVVVWLLAQLQTCVLLSKTDDRDDKLSLRLIGIARRQVLLRKLRQRQRQREKERMRVVANY